MISQKMHITLPPNLRTENAVENFFLQKLIALLILFYFSVSSETLAEPIRKSSLLYENPFDLCAGGASLTRATQEGVFFSNPSLPALGGGVFRWIYGRTGLHFGADAIDLARSIYSKSKTGSAKVDSSMIERILKTPVHVGNDVNLGFLTAFGGAGIFQISRADIEGRQFGSSGLPEVRTRAEGAAGIVGSASIPIGDALALGGSLKPTYASETIETIALSDFSGGGAKQMLSDLKNNTQFGLGVAGALGMTAQLRTQNFDLRLAGTIDDLGQTKFNNENVSPWKQTINVGVGLVPHTRSSALHCAFDLRDIKAVYGEHWTRRSRAGCKALLSSRIGIGAGYYQGWPSYGAVLNLTIMRLEAGSYTREFGREAGTRGRRVYFVATGFEMP